MRFSDMNDFVDCNFVNYSGIGRSNEQLLRL